MNRYARQELLSEVGKEGLTRLKSTKIVVVGAGGLAAPALPVLAGAGIGCLVIIDDDQVELNNLHRQTLFAEKDVGQKKAEVAAERCRGLNSEINVRSIVSCLTPENVSKVTLGADLVLDCADSYAVSYCLSDHCQKAGIPLISASVLGMSGYVGGFCGGAPSVRAVFPEAPENGASCATSGVLGSAVAILGAMQAQMALSLVLGLDPSPLGQLVTVDAARLRSSTMRFDGAKEPQSHFAFVAAAQLKQDDQIFDLRAPSEVSHPLHDRSEFASPDVTQLEKGRRVALCCATGLRAWRAAESLSKNWPGEIVLVAASAS